MQKTPFAGLTLIEPGDNIYADGNAFLLQDRRIIDHFLRLGALTHRHDGHAPLVTPAAAPTVIADQGGALPAGTTIRVGHTWVDADGGETRLSPVANALTPGGLAPPGAPTAVADYAAGDLLPEVYRYALTLTDGQGGETPIGDYVEVLLESGHANASITISDMQALMGAAAGWRLYRSKAGGFWYFQAAGVADAITDDGHLCVDCDTEPPSEFDNTTSQTGRLRITVPAPPADAVSYRIYASVTGAFTSPALMGTYPAAEYAIERELLDLGLQLGGPPIVATSVGGAARIGPGDLVDFTWQAPVATEADLPPGPTPADTVIVMADANGQPALFVADAGGVWRRASAAATSSGAGVALFDTAFDDPAEFPGTFVVVTGNPQVANGRLTVPDGSDLILLHDELSTNLRQMTKFTVTDTNTAYNEIELLARRLVNGNALRATVLRNYNTWNLVVRMGTNTRISPDPMAEIVRNSPATFWLVQRMVGPTIIAELYDAHPALGALPLFSVPVTIGAGDAATYAQGRTALRVSGLPVVEVDDWTGVDEAGQPRTIF